MGFQADGRPGCSQQRRGWIQQPPALPPPPSWAFLPIWLVSIQLKGWCCPWWTLSHSEEFHRAGPAKNGPLH